jgi:hypothetical protein
MSDLQYSGYKLVTRAPAKSIYLGSSYNLILKVLSSEMDKAKSGLI